MLRVPGIHRGWSCSEGSQEPQAPPPPQHSVIEGVQVRSRIGAKVGTEPSAEAIARVFSDTRSRSSEGSKVLLEQMKHPMFVCNLIK